MIIIRINAVKADKHKTGRIIPERMKK